MEKKYFEYYNWHSDALHEIYRQLDTRFSFYHFYDLFCHAGIWDPQKRTRNKIDRYLAERYLWPIWLVCIEARPPVREFGLNRGGIKYTKYTFYWKVLCIIKDGSYYIHEYESTTGAYPTTTYTENLPPLPWNTIPLMEDQIITWSTALPKYYGQIEPRSNLECMEKIWDEIEPIYSELLVRMNPSNAPSKDEFLAVIFHATRWQARHATRSRADRLLKSFDEPKLYVAIFNNDCYKPAAFDQGIFYKKYARVMIVKPPWKPWTIVDFISGGIKLPTLDEQEYPWLNPNSAWENFIEDTTQSFFSFFAQRIIKECMKYVHIPLRVKKKMNRIGFDLNATIQQKLIQIITQIMRHGELQTDFEFRGAVIYGIGIIISKFLQCRNFLSAGLVAEVCGVTHYSIRSKWRRFVSPYISYAISTPEGKIWL